MNNVTGRKRKSARSAAITVAAGIFASALIGGVGVLTFSGIVNARKSNGVLSAKPDSAYDAEYTYGETYNIKGVKYTLGGAENKGMEYNTALGLGDDCEVTLQSFTYADGSDGTAETDSVLNAGTYALNVAQGDTQYSATVRVGQQPIDFRTVDGIPLFVNASSPRYQAHGDIMSVYKHNDGWYPSQKAGEVPVEIRTITNAYYYETGNEVPIKIAGEVLPDNNAKSTTSTLPFTLNDGTQITFSITERAGTVFTQSNEYAATFKFNLTGDDKNNYYFDYGGATEDDEIKDSNKCLSITQREEDSFVLSKHWFIVRYANLFVGPDDWNGGVDSTNNPYVPFHTETPYYSAPKTGEGSYGETYTALDTVTYLPDDFEVYTPYAKFTDKSTTVKIDGKDHTQYTAGAITFDVIYDDLGGNKYRITQGAELGTADTADTKTLSYYFNKSMPAGHYTLKLYGELDGDRIQGEYWLTVLPKKMDKTLVNNLQTAIQGGAGGNAFLQGTGIHADVSTQIAALNTVLENTLEDNEGYWGTTAAAGHFATEVTIMYNRDNWSASNYVSYTELVGMLPSAGEYNLYYSIAAKNYVTAGGADDKDRTNYGFRTKLSSGVPVSDIYNLIISEGPYFKNVPYTGNDAKTTVPTDSRYTASFDGEYVNVGNYTVTLTLTNGLTSWANDTQLSNEDFSKYFELVNDSTLKVKFEIEAADNGWNVTPKMSPWSYDGFNQNVNTLTAGLKFGSNVKYALIPNTVDPDSVKGNNAIDGVVYFTVGANGMVDSATAAKLNLLKPATYHLKYFADAVKVSGSETVNVKEFVDVILDAVTVSKAVNEWVSAPRIISWAYGSFESSYFIAGEPTYKDSKDENGNPAAVTYKVTGGKLTSAVTLAFNANGTLADVSVNALNALAVSSDYTLTVTYPGTDNYEEIDNSKAPIGFAVIKTANSWSTRPRMIGWTYGSFDRSYFIAGVPAFTNAGDKVTYKLTKPGDADFTDYTFTALSEDYFKYLSAGTYRINVSYPGTDNYNELKAEDTEITFTVAQLTNNNWQGGVSPDIIGWTYGGYTEGLFTNGTPEYGTVKYTVKDLVGNEDVYGGKTYAELKALLEDLPAGSYELQATSGSTSDYTAATWSKQFVVAMADNEWQTNPAVSGWVYDGSAHAPSHNGAVKYEKEKADVSGAYYLTEDGNPTGNALSSVTDAGNYAYVLTVEDTANYNGFTTTLYFTVARAQNDWKTKPASTVTWKYNAADNANIEFVALYNNDKLVITVGGTEISASSLNATLANANNYGVGRYTIVATVPAYGNYTAIEALTVTLVIEQAEDSFGAFNIPGWEWDDVSQKTDIGGVAWQTNWNTALEVPVPAVGTTATAIVYNGAVEELAVTLHYEVTEVLTTDLNALKSKLLGLHVGTYTIEFVVADSANYKGCKVSTTFSVDKVNNAWEANGAPDIAGWQYGNSVANPTATPKYGKGTVRFSYAKAGSETIEDLREGKVTLNWQDGTDTAGGTYWLRAYVPGTDDYNELVGYKLFDIDAGQNGWVNNPGVITWNWNGYSKTTNLFSGSARNNGTATFRIYAVLSGSNVRNLAASDFVFNGETVSITDSAVIKQFTTDGFALTAENGVMVVSDNVAKYLKALKPGSYSLNVTIAADNNYDELSGSVTFTVGQAANSWATGKAPAVSSYTYNNFNSTTTFTYGEMVYGAASDISYKIEGTEGSAFTAETFVSTGGKPAYVKVQERLATLGAGNYTLSAWVAAAANGTYSTPYSADSPYTTRTFVVSRATNGWKTGKAPVDVAANYTVLHAKNDDGEDNFAANFQSLFGVPEAVEGTVSYRLLTTDNKEAVNGYISYEQLVEEVSKLVGEYFIESSVSVGTTLNYNAIAPVITSVNIRRYVSAFGSFPDKLTGKWGKNDTTTLDTVNITAFYGIVGDDGKLTDTKEITSRILFVLDGERSLADFRNYVKTLGADTYQVTVQVEATNDYGELSRTVQLVISPADNRITPSGFVLTTSSIGSGEKAQTQEDIIYSWKQSGKVAWQGATLLYGTTAYVSVRYKNSGYDLRRFTVDMSDENKQGALDTVSEYVSGLEVGNYTLYIETPAATNWNVKSNQIDFTVTPDSNDWKTDGEVGKAPYISGDKCTYDAQSGKYVWTYGDSASVVAAAVRGTPVIKFYKGSALQNVMPTAAGEYRVEISVPEVNSLYAGIDDVVINFVIEKALDDYFIVFPGVTGWTWGQYDRAVNVLNGSPRVETVGATVTFAIGKGTDDEHFEVISVDGTRLEGITLTNGLVDTTTAGLIAKLTGGTSTELNTTTYTLRVSVSATDNYLGFNSYETFNVTGATNAWINPPAVTPWTASNWTLKNNMPSASSHYGIPEITIINDFTKEVVFHGRYIAEGSDEFDTEAGDYVNDLSRSGSGWYVMTTTVEPDTGKYNNTLSASYKFQIFIEGVDGETNYWQVDATIVGWEANIEGNYNPFTAEPLHGLANIVFYVANEDGSPDLTQEIDRDTEGAVLLKKGNEYENDIYIPMAPGDYIMVATTSGVLNTETGEMVGALDNLGDDLTKGQARKVPFTIRPRALTFEEELRIDTLLYLGDRVNWTDPTAKATLDDADFEYVYTNKETGETSSEMPTKAGKYTVTVTISAKYADSKPMSVDFTVELSPNSWVAAPNIKDWSAEFDPNAPEGTANVGSDEIKYTYASVKEPDKILTEVPTEEGTYIMYADVEVEGYEPLHAEYIFTIEPAFDMDLLLVDIALGIIACVMSIVLINIIIRRHKRLHR